MSSHHLRQHFVLDTVGGETLERSYAVLKKGGLLCGLLKISKHLPWDMPAESNSRSRIVYTFFRIDLETV
jgi:NADPH:quinone reductase-like Zn-dependent oxidoreductase